MNSIIITISLCAISLAPYAVWFSRWNIPAHLSLAFAITAYIVPGLLTDGILNFPPKLVDLYSDILALGAFSFCVGCALGAVVRPNGAGKIYFLTSRVQGTLDFRTVAKRARYIGYFGVIGLLISFVLMGFVPMFADDPFSAKFFRGQYKEAYERVAVLYRSAHFSLSLLVPILLALWFDTRKLIYLYLGIAAVAALTLSLTRSPAAVGVVLWLSIWAVHRRNLFWPYLILLVFIYAFGGATFAIFNSYISGVASSLNVWDLIAQGAPDIVDQLNFLEAFNRKEEFTYGRTIFGGLIPGNYKWNPSVWTLAVMNDTDDVSSIASGGLRLPVPLWGYANFSWIGVVLLSFFAGGITAWATVYLRRYLKSNLFTHSAVVLAIHASVWAVFINFYRLSFYTVFQIAIIYVLAGTWKRVKFRR